MSMTQTKIRIADIEASETGALYVLNNTKGKDRAQIIITVPRQNGGYDTAIAAATWIPQDLTAQVSKKQLLASSDFRKAINVGLLSLIDETTALRMLEEPGASLELNKIHQMQNLVAEVPEIKSTIEESSVDPAISNVIASLSGDEDKPAAGIELLVVELEEGNRTELDTLNEVRNFGELNVATLKYLLNKARQHNWAKIGKWAKNLLRSTGNE